MRKTRMEASHCRNGRGPTFALGLLAGLLPGIAAAEVAIEQTPLFISASVRPNVMLQFDNSGSMNNMIWDDGYDPGVVYPNWANYSCSHSFRSGNPCWTEEEGSVILRQLTDSDNGDCNDGRVRGRNESGTERCLLLPDPVGGGDTRYAGNYLNYLFETYATVSGNNGRDIGSEIPNDYRLQVAKQVATQIVEDNGNVNFGLARFNPPSSGNEGGTIIADCGASTATLLDEIDGLQPDSNTPLAETFYEITRYFRGLSGYYGNENGGYESPINYRCQRNFVIAVTDGLPTYDNLDIDNHDDPDLPGPNGETLPDWDGEHPHTTGLPYPQYSDGTDPDAENQVEGATLFLDDLAKFGYDLDLKKSGNDITGGSYEDETYDPQRLETYTVGFAVDNQMLEDAADYGNGEYFTADNLAELTTALQGALSDIADKTSTAASLAATSTQASSSTRVFQATFNSGQWSGELSAYQYGTDPALNDPEWQASDGIPAHGSRDIYTIDADGDGVDFIWNQIGSDAQTALGSEAVLNYIRGSDADSLSNGGEFRDRVRLLGDIVHSTPAYAGDRQLGYRLLPSTEGSSYRAFVGAKESKPDIVLVGANDGMLHAFDVEDGSERFAYVPRYLHDALPDLTHSGYGVDSEENDNPNHRYYVDGSPRVVDAWFGSAWHTVAVTTLERGGPAVFALDVTDPAHFDSGDVLWEIDPGNASTGGDYLGEAMGQSAVVRTESGDWVAILGNGYNSTAGTAALIVVELSSGDVLRVLDTGTGGGLSTPVAVDRDRNGSVDTAYAGDLDGNLWQFDLSGSSNSDWEIAYGGTPLFTTGSSQPITARPDVIDHPEGGIMVVFGTGQYLALADEETTDVQSVYGVRDTGGNDNSIGGIGDLQEQEVLETTTANGNEVRVLSRNTVNYSEKRGWVFDLNKTGERITRHVDVFDGKAIMVSTIPEEDPCAFGGDSALIEIDPLTGTQFDEPVLDLNEDGVFDGGDSVTVDIEGEEDVVVYPGIVDMDVGLATNPYVLYRQDGNQEKLVTGSNLQTQTVGERSFGDVGRASWLQIR